LNAAEKNSTDGGEFVLDPRTFQYIGVRDNAGTAEESWTVVTATGPLCPAIRAPGRRSSASRRVPASARLPTLGVAAIRAVPAG
jgi:hypothetical protein